MNNDERMAQKLAAILPYLNEKQHRLLWAVKAGRKKTEAMRHVEFPLKARLEMTTVTLIFYAVLLIIPFLIFWRPYALLLLGLMAAMAYFYGIFLPQARITPASGSVQRSAQALAHCPDVAG
jgi:predicted PurR-regulated permease PerM